MRSVVTLLLLVSMLAIAVTDLVTPRGFAHGTLYLLPLGCAFLSGSRHVLLVTFLAAVVLTLLGALLSSPGLDFAYFVSNRIVSALVLLGFWGLLRWVMQREELTERIQHALAELGLGVFLTDLQGRVRWQNDALAELEQEPLQRVIVPDDGEQSAEIRSVLDAAGNVLDLRRRMRAIRGEDGRVNGYVGVVESITPGDVWQQTLSEVRVGHASVLESISESILAVDARWRVTYLNAAAERLLGVERRELLGRTLDEIDPDLMGSAIGATYREAFESGKQRRVEAHFARIDAWLDVLVFPHAQGVTFIFRDVTAERALRVKMEQAERESREQAMLLRSVIDGLSEGLLVVDREGRTLLANRQTFRYVDEAAEASAFGGIEAQDTLFLDDEVTPLPFEDWPVVRALAGQEVNEIRLFLRNGLHPEGVPIRVSARPLMEEDGTILGAIAWFRDVSDLVTAEKTRREIEEELRHAQRLEAMGQLTGGVAHDFNNLLTVIVGNADLLVSTPDLDEEAEESASMILAAVEKASRLVQQLLAFSRRQPLSPIVFDPVERLANFLPLLQRTLGETIDLQLKGEAGRFAAVADPTQLESAVLNLCVNARDAMTEGGRVRIAVATTELTEDDDDLPAAVEPGTYVSVTVADEGIGMSDEVLERAFEPFFTTKEVGHGSGLGLSMVFGFVRQSMGHLRISSEQGKGTRIELLLPLARDDLEGLTEDGHRPPVRSGAREQVLVVEDDPMVCDLIRITLEELGYRAHMARNGEQALELAAMTDMDVLLTDLVLPGPWNGMALAELLRSRYQNIRVLVMTGYGTEMATKTGAEAVLRKPFRRSELAARLRQVLEE